MAEKSNHISRIIDTVLKAAEGDHSVRVDTHDKDDELKPLCHAINKMVETMRKHVAGCRQVEVDLKKSEEKFRRLKENIPGMVYLFVKHPDGSYSFPYVNDASRQLFNIDPDDLMRDSTLITRLIHPDDRERFEESVKQSAETLQPWREELRHVVNGEVRWYDCMSRPEIQSNGNILWDGIILEITDRKQLEEQLLQSQKMEAIGQLAGGVAHDFNNMLSVILGYLELIKSRLSAGNPLLKDVLEIERAANHSRDITRQLLAFSRKQIIAPKTVDLNKLITQTKKTLSRLIGEDIHLRFLPEKNLGKVRFDPSQMDQILVNLAVNACDAMPDGGMLTIEISKITLDEDYCRLHIECRPGHYVLMMVSDNGTGMEKETLSHIFEPFFTTKEVGKGTGLGLATVYGIVKQKVDILTCIVSREREQRSKSISPESWKRMK